VNRFPGARRTIRVSPYLFQAHDSTAQVQAEAFEPGLSEKDIELFF
jgi:hypothetical protein